MKSSHSVLLTLLVALPGFAPAQTPSVPLLRNTFKDSADGWQGGGPTGKVSLSHDPAVVAANGGALKFDYEVGKPGFNLLYLPTPVGTLAKAKSIKFRVRSDSTTMIAVILQEEDGGRYVAKFTAPSGAWQPIELSTADFDLSLEKDDPKDPDAKLDMDVVNSIAIVDLSQMFAQVDNPVIKSLLNVRSGPHTLFIDDFNVSPDPVAWSSSSLGEDIVLETFAHPQLAWFGMGGVALSKANGGPLGETSLKAEYHQTPGKIAGLTRSISPWIMTATKSLTFDVATAQSAKLIVQLEEIGGGKYNAVIDVPGGSTMDHIRLHYADFKPAEDSPDPTGKLDVAKVKTLVIIDASGMAISAEQPNTLWLGNFRASAK